MKLKPKNRTHGEGSYYRDRNYYAWKIRVNGTDVVRKASTQAALAKKVTAARAELDRAGLLLTDARDGTIEQYVNRWYREKIETRRALNTATQYRDILDKYVIPTLGSKRVRRVLADPKPFFTDLVAAMEKHFASGPHAGNRTVSLACTILASALGISLKSMTQSLDALDLPRPAQPRERILESHQVDAFFAALYSNRIHEKSSEPFYRDRYLIELLLNTGLRISEAIGLSVFSLDLSQRQIRVDRQWNGKHKTFTPTKNRTNRIVPLNENAYVAVQGQLDLLRAERDAAGALYEDHGLLFPTAHGKIHSARNVARTLERVCERAGIPKIAPHDLRRTFGTAMAGVETNMKVTAAVLGDKDLKTVYNHYNRAEHARAIESTSRVSFGVRK